MSERGNIEWIAAKVGEIDKLLKQHGDKRLDAFTDLLSSIESAMADLVSHIEKGGGEAAIKSMASALRDMRFPTPEVHVEVSPTPVNVEVKVPEHKAPAVNVQVQPTPVTVEAVLPAPVVHNTINLPDPKSATWEIKLPGVYGAPDRVMTITRKP